MQISHVGSHSGLIIHGHAAMGGVENGAFVSLVHVWWGLLSGDENINAESRSGFARCGRLPTHASNRLHTESGGI